MRKLVAAFVAVLTTVGVGASGAMAYPSGGALPPPLTLVIQIAGQNGVPIDAVGVAMNVTVTNPAAAGFLTAYPCGDRPLASNLNYVADQTVPNFVISALSPDGEVCIDTIAVVDIVVDLAGYLPAGSPVVTLPDPKRIVDSRSGVGVPHRLAAGDVAAVQVGGMSGVPADAAMVLFNATAVDTGTPGFLTVYPCGEDVPSTSTLNFPAGAIVPNFVLARLGAAGQVCVYTMSPLDLIIDVAGYIPAGAGGIVSLAKPERILDSRDGTGGPLAQLTPAGRTLQVTGVAGVPGTATGVVVNLTATRAGSDGYVSAFPCGGTAPLVSNLNFTPNASIANLAIVQLGTGGQLCFLSNTAVDVIADVTGYLDGDSSITTLPPTRLYDSREGVDPTCNIGVQEVSNGLRVLDLRTDTTLTTIPWDYSGGTPRAHVRSDCQHVDVTGFVSPSGYFWWEFDTTGNLIAHSQLPGLINDAFFSGDGPLDLAYISQPVPFTPVGWAVVDAVSNTQLFWLPPLTPDVHGWARTWKAAGATADGSLIALSTDTVDHMSKEVSFWTSDGVLLGGWTTPVGALDVQLSPLGSYVSYVVATGPLVYVQHVVTLSGDPVVDLPNAIFLTDEWHDAWISDGAIMGCVAAAGAQRAVRWDLFSPIKPLVAGNIKHLCLTAAG